MCGKCEPLMAKAGMGIGLLSIVLAVASRLAGFHPMGLGPRSFAAMAVVMLLLVIAVNTHHHSGAG